MITITFQTVEAALKALQTLVSPTATPEAETTKKSKKSEPATAPTPAPAAAQVSASGAAQGAAVEKPLAGTPNAETPKDPSPSDVMKAYEPVAAAIQALVKKDRAKAVEILAEFGVKRGTELKPEQYTEILGKLNAQLTPEEALS